MKKRNGEQVKLVLSLLLLLSGIGLVVWAVLSRDDGSGWSYAVLLLGSLVALTGLLMSLVFLFRARILADILSEQGVLGRWIYPSEQLNKLAQASLENLQMARVASRILALVFIVIGGIVYGVDPAHPVIFLVALSSVALILLVVVHSYTGHKMRQRRSAAETVVFQRRGLLYNGQLYAWDGLLYKLEAVLADPQDPTCLLVAFKFFHGRYIHRQRGLLVIPAPEKKAETVNRLVEIYARPASPELLSFLAQERTQD